MAALIALVATNSLNNFFPVEYATEIIPLSGKIDQDGTIITRKGDAVVFEALQIDINANLNNIDRIDITIGDICIWSIPFSLVIKLSTIKIYKDYYFINLHKDLFIIEGHKINELRVDNLPMIALYNPIDPDDPKTKVRFILVPKNEFIFSCLALCPPQAKPKPRKIKLRSVIT